MSWTMGLGLVCQRGCRGKGDNEINLQMCINLEKFACETAKVMETAGTNPLDSQFSPF